MFEDKRRDLTHLEKELGKVRKFCRENGMGSEDKDCGEGDEVISFVKTLLERSDNSTLSGSAEASPKCSHPIDRHKLSMHMGHHIVTCLKCGETL